MDSGLGASRRPGMTNDKLKSMASRSTATAAPAKSAIGKSPRSIQPRDHGQALDLAVPVGVQERVVVLERNAAVGITVGAEHVGMREQTAPPEDRFVAADGSEPQRRHPMEQRLPRLQVVDVWRRRARHLDVGEFGLFEVGPILPVALASADA